MQKSLFDTTNREKTKEERRRKTTKTTLTTSLMVIRPSKTWSMIALQPAA
jgi:hypothetical protein